MIKINILFCLLLAGLAGQSCDNSQGTVEISKDGTIETNGITFEPRFFIIHSENDPKPSMRPVGIKDVSYNVITWKGNVSSENQIQKVEKDTAQAGDGFDESILEGEVENRTANLFGAGEIIKPTIREVKETEKGFNLNFEENEYAEFKVKVSIKGKYPEITYNFSAKKPGYYSIGYVGAPSHAVGKVKEIWQPLLWQEKRFPRESFLTLAFRAPIPSSLVTHNGTTYGVVAHPNEYPFTPLPTQENSRFGVGVRNREGKAQPYLFAPVLGGKESEFDKGESHQFRMVLWADKYSLTESYEQIATNIFNFHDYRRNDITTLNNTLQNILDYSMSKYSHFIDSLKGFGYSTDVPGAVKNVSSLNPLEMAILTDDSVMYEERAYPLIEYMLSREKFLFSMDPEQKIQNPSRDMKGPVAPVSELTALYEITGRSNEAFLEMAKEEYNSARTRNLDVKEPGKTWQNALALYKATKNNQYLEEAKKGADKYIASRIEKMQTGFDDPAAGGLFFWTGFTPKWIDLLELYEVTKAQKYLNAAQKGARHYTMFCWMSPKIPDDSILVNEDGKAPMYWYLESKGHEQMYSPEEKAPAWRLSEIGLTPESSGTSAGHRAIFMANYAPWMLRIGYYAQDKFLKNVAKAAIIGRYRNFPGYHINTERTTIYEKADYPLKPHKELSVNSFHYNHILPMASMLVDYLVSDVFVRSEGKITFPSQFIEGYAYLQNKFYGHKPGKFYGHDAWLYMPDDVLRVASTELNYIAARGEDAFMVALANQSDQKVESKIALNPDVLPVNTDQSYKTEIWLDNEKQTSRQLENNTINIDVPPNGLTALKINGLSVEPDFQKALLTHNNEWEDSYKKLEFGDARVMILEAGEYESTVYGYLRQDDSVFDEVTLTYEMDGKSSEVQDPGFPYEFTLSIPKKVNNIKLKLSGKKTNGRRAVSDLVTFQK